MLTKLEIANYRGFKSYRMDGLSKVNLLVGKNNSGKTALLEGLQFLTSRGDPAVLEDVARRRGEVISRPDPSVLVGVEHLFHGHAIGPNAKFTFTGDNGYSPISVSIHQIKNEKDDPQRRLPSHGLILKIGQPHGTERDEPIYPITREGGVEFETGPRYRRSSAQAMMSKPQGRFVGPDSLTSFDIARMWDEVTVNRKESDVAMAMRVIQPDVESVHILAGVFAQGYVQSSRAGIVVGMAGQETRVPLGSMGDGMRRIMALATSLAFAKGGCLFVDELDTGLHYSVMTDMWKLVITRAIESDVQVFATTHSWDCIEGLSSYCQLDPSVAEMVSIHKIDSTVPHSIRFGGDSIVKMVKADIDPR